MRKRTLCFVILALLTAVATVFIIRLSFFEGELSEAELPSPVEIAECVPTEKNPESIEKATSIPTMNISIPEKSFSNTLEKESEGKVFKFADTNFPMTFVDGDWSEELKNLVHEDMTLIFSHLTNYEIINDPRPPEAYQLNGEAVISTNYILFKGRGIFRPDEYVGETGRLVRRGGEWHLVVSEELLAVYEKALEYKRNNRDMFDKLDEFVATLNDPEEVDRVFNNAQLSRDMFYFYKETPWEEDSAYQRNIEGYGRVINVRKPSVLSFDEKDHDGKKIIIASPLISLKEDPNFFTDFPPFCYVNNKWYICVPWTP